MRGRRRLLPVLYVTAGASYLLDRGTKVLAERHLDPRDPVELIPGVLQLRLTTNTGGAFGLFAGQPWLFFVATLIVSVAIVVAAPRVTSPASAVGLGLVLGGALGNLTDRVLRGDGISGGVVDFIDLRVWPVFNVADSSIVIGALLLVIASFREREPAPAA